VRNNFSYVAVEPSAGFLLLRVHSCNRGYPTCCVAAQMIILVHVLPFLNVFVDDCVVCARIVVIVDSFA